MKLFSAPRLFSAAVTSIALGFVALPSLAGVIIIETSSERPVRTTASGPLLVPADDVFCRYIPTSDTDRFGPNTAITLLETQGNSTFRYEQFPSTSPIAQLPRRTSRTITFRNTSAEQARRHLANRPADYANLLGLPSTNRIVRNGFRDIDRQFACQPFNDVVTATAQLPSSSARLSVPRIDTSLAALPNGNYRVVSPTGLNNSLQNSTLQNSTLPSSIGLGNSTLDNSPISNNNEFSQPEDSALFTFRKFGNSIVGNFEYSDSDLAACVSGTVEGNTIIGEAVTGSRSTFVLGQAYLGPSLSLQLGEFVAGDRYTESTLDLNGFSRINAGTTAPPTACTFR